MLRSAQPCFWHLPSFAFALILWDTWNKSGICAAIQFYMYLYIAAQVREKDCNLSYPCYFKTEI